MKALHHEERPTSLVPFGLQEQFEAENPSLDLTASNLQSLGGVIYSNFKTRLVAREWLAQHEETPK